MKLKDFDIKFIGKTVFVKYNKNKHAVLKIIGLQSYYTTKQLVSIKTIEEFAIEVLDGLNHFSIPLQEIEIIADVIEEANNAFEGHLPLSIYKLEEFKNDLEGTEAKLVDLDLRLINMGAINCFTDDLGTAYTKRIDFIYSDASLEISYSPSGFTSIFIDQVDILY